VSEIQKNPAFNFQINLAGVQAAAGSRDLPSGFYKAKIIDCYHRKASTGRDMIEFKTEVVEGEFAGVVRTSRINVPTSPDDGVRHYWRALMESVGYNAAQIDGAGVISITRDIYVDKPCAIHYTAGDKAAGIFDNLNFVSNQTWEVGMKADLAAKAAMGSAAGAPAAAQGLGGFNTPAPAQGLGAPAPAPATGGLGGLGGGGGAAPQGAMSSNALLSALGSPS